MFLFNKFTVLKEISHDTFCISVLNLKHQCLYSYMQVTKSELQKIHEAKNKQTTTKKGK